ncbi:MAG: PilZ domain-containing protein [Acidobacteriota bacterium]|nr:PilZ domain-containing protein [Acidobacteriota bacterium]
MTHFPRPTVERRATRVKLASSVPALVRLDDGQRAKCKLRTISVTGGLLQLPKALQQGGLVEVAFQTDSGAVHGMAEVLNPSRHTQNGVLQAFRFIALADQDHQILATEVDTAADRSCFPFRATPPPPPKGW